MKHLSFREVFLIVCFSSFSLFSSLAEGTAELTPITASEGHGVMQIWPDNENDLNRSSFTYGCPDERKLKFTICNPGETVYFGMSFDVSDMDGTQNSLWYRIINPNATVQVFPATGWQQVTNTGAGSIGSYAQAVAGPSNIIGGASGYTPLSFTPTEGGEFYIEFYRIAGTAMPTAINTPITGMTEVQIAAQEHLRTRLRYFDLTVTDAPNGNRIRGRLFTKAWELSTSGNPFVAKLYAYSSDGIVTSIKFNGIRPANGLLIAANSFGVSTAGNAFQNRKSVTGNSVNPQYKLFLNNPDECAYGTGVFGDITGTVTISGNDPRELCINIRVDKAGNVDLLFNLNGEPGYQEGSADRVISAALKVGSNCVEWDSKDGNGDVIHPGPIDMTVNYYNGKFNIPVFNANNHPDGFIIARIRPTGFALTSLWDDSNISGFTPSATVSLAGCTNPMGCHKWGSLPDGTVPAGNPAIDFGINTTLNTFWYANLVDVNASYDYPNIVEFTIPEESSTVVLNTAPFTLSGGYPSGGTYSGPGVTNNIFDPAAAGSGTHIISYTYDFEHEGTHPAARTAHVSEYSYTVTDQIVVSAATGVLENNTVVRGIYPNPNNGSFHIVGSMGAAFTLHDATGKLIQSIQISESDHFLQNNLKQGMYHYTLRDAAQNSISGSMIVF